MADDAIVGELGVDVTSLRLNRDSSAPRRRGVAWAASALVASVVIVGVGAATWWLVQGERRNSGAVLRYALVRGAEARQEKRPRAAELRVSGTVRASQRATVSARVTGRLVKVYVEEGDRVAPGERIAKLDTEIARRQAKVAEARLETASNRVHEVNARLENARDQLQRLAGVRRSGGTTEERVETAKSKVQELEARRERVKAEVKVKRRSHELAKARLSQRYVEAPFRGRVVAKHATVGEIISPAAMGGFTQTGICTVAAVDSLKISAQIAEDQVRKIEDDNAIRVSSGAYPDSSWRARVTSVGPAVDESTGTVDVTAVLEEPGDALLLGMTVDLSFLKASVSGSDVGGGRGAVAVPVDAVRNRGGSPVVFVVKRHGLHRVEVEVIGQRGGLRWVKGDLDRDDRVAVSYSRQLTHGATVGDGVRLVHYKGDSDDDA